QNVCVGKRVSREIQLREMPRLVCVTTLILFYNRWDDVTADVLDAGQVSVLHPTEVTARYVEQHPCFQLSQCLGQFGAHHFRGIQSRPNSRPRLGIGPEISGVDPREPLLQSQILQLLGTLGESSLRDRHSSLSFTQGAGT